MAKGYSYPFHKRAVLGSFDGSATAKTLWLPPGAPITAINVSVGMTSDSLVSAARWYGAFVLEFWNRVTAAWVEILSLDVELITNTTALAISSKADHHNIIYAPPLIMPAPFDPSIPTDDAGKNFVPANVHTGAVAGETDVRMYVKSSISAIAGSIFSATVMCME